MAEENKSNFVLHDLKIWPGPFGRVRSGIKRYEIRKDDRNFKIGDVLYLREWDPAEQKYTGAALFARVTDKTEGGKWDLPESMCVLGISRAVDAHLVLSEPNLGRPSLFHEVMRIAIDEARENGMFMTSLRLDGHDLAIPDGASLVLDDTYFRGSR